MIGWAPYFAKRWDYLDVPNPGGPTLRWVLQWAPHWGALGSMYICIELTHVCNKRALYTCMYVFKICTYVYVCICYVYVEVIRMSMQWSVSNLNIIQTTVQYSWEIEISKKLKYRDNMISFYIYKSFYISIK